MSNKKVSDTLAQQRKAREDFLNLKKMQNGEVAPEPKPSEVAVSPKTFKEKLQNYWFHFKWHTVAVIFAVIVLAISISQCASKTNWDMQVIYFTYTAVIDNQLESVGDYFKTLSQDLNGDGEININIINCSIADGNFNNQYGQTALMKLQTIIAAEPEVMLYITDSASAEFFEKDALKDIFVTEQIPLTEEFYEITASPDFGKLPEGLQIACRKISDTTIEKQKNAEELQKAALEILEKLK